MITLDTDERIDEMGFRGLKIIQRKSAFAYGIDAVLLADFAATILKARGKKKGNRSEHELIELGAGTGAVSLIISRKVEDCRIKGVEFQEELHSCFARSVKLNQLEERIDPIHSDIIQMGSIGVDVDMVVANPPYERNSEKMVSKNSMRAKARHESTATLQDFIRIGSELLSPGGSMCMVHRPSRLVDILHYGRLSNLEGKDIRFISPTQQKPPNIVLIHFKKNGGKELNVMEHLHVYNEEGRYSDRILKMYGI